MPELKKYACYFCPVHVRRVKLIRVSLCAVIVYTLYTRYTIDFLTFATVYSITLHGLTELRPNNCSVCTLNNLTCYSLLSSVKTFVVYTLKVLNF